MRVGRLGLRACLGAALLSAVGGKREQWGAPLPTRSWLAPFNASANGVESDGRWEYYDLHEVMYQGGEFLFFQEQEGPVEGLPEVAILNRYELQLPHNLTRVHPGNRHEHPQACAVWEERPALVFASTGWDTNINEFFSNALMPVFQNALATGLYDVGARFPAGAGVSDADVEALFSPATKAPFVLIGERPQAFTQSPWGYLWGYLTTEQWLLGPALDGYCFRRLVVSEHATLRFLYEHTRERGDAAWEARLRGWMAAFQRFVRGAEESHRRSLGAWPPHVVTDWGRKRVTLISRPLKRARARGLLNEADIVRHITDRFDCNVTLTDFRMPLAGALQLMQHTDVLVGMHGAGLTNAFWLPPGAVILQLVPYGWELHPGQLMRSVYSADLAVAIGGHYRQWINPHAHNAHFAEADFEGEWRPNWGPRRSFQPHPTADLPRPHDWDPPRFWEFQNTWVDLGSFGPLLEEALALGGVPRWGA